MHLVNPVTTFIGGVVFAVMTLWLFSWIADSVEGGKPASIVLCMATLFVFGAVWVKYVRAFRMRKYDRSYAYAKKQLWKTLTVILPTGGDVEILSGDIELEIERFSLILRDDAFHVVVNENEEVSYDSDSMTHRVIVPWRNFYVSRGDFYVEKSFNAHTYILVRNDTDEDAEDLSMVNDVDLKMPVKQVVKFRRRIPQSLRNASIDELYDLNLMLQRREEGTVS